MILAIDIGSNTSKCLLGRVSDARVLPTYEKTLDARILGEGGELVNNAGEIISNAILFFENEASIYDENFKTVIVATSALRDSSEKAKILKEVFEKTSRDIKILSGDAEARLSFCGATSDSSVDSSRRCAYFDLGGGSMEVVFGKNGVVDFATSIPVGAVRLYRGYSSPEDYFKVSREAIASALSDFSVCDSLVGAGGAVAAARLMKRKLNMDGAENTISLEQIKKLYEVVADLGAKRLTEKFSIRANRADILQPAFACIIALMEFLNSQELTHTFCNIRYGIILSGGNID